MKGFDISSMMKQMNNMQQKLQEQMQKMNENKESKEYQATAGDDGIQVSVVIDGNFNIKNIDIHEQLKKFIVCDADIYFTVLVDLIIAAFHKAKDQAETDAGNSAAGMEDMIPADMKNMLGNLGNLLK